MNTTRSEDLVLQLIYLPTCSSSLFPETISLRPLEDLAHKHIVSKNNFTGKIEKVSKRPPTVMPLNFTQALNNLHMLAFPWFSSIERAWKCIWNSGFISSPFSVHKPPNCSQPLFLIDCIMQPACFLAFKMHLRYAFKFSSQLERLEACLFGKKPNSIGYHGTLNRNVTLPILWHPELI